MSGGTRIDAGGSWCGVTVRGVGKMSLADWSMVHAERSRPRPTPWRVLSDRLGVVEADLRDAFYAPEIRFAGPIIRGNFDELEARRFHRMWNAGLPVQEIAHAFGRSHHWVSRTVEKMGLRRRSSGRPPVWWSQGDTDQLRLMIARGNTAREIAEALGKSRSAVIGRAWRLGLTLRRGRPPSHPQADPDRQQAQAA